MKLFIAEYARAYTQRILFALLGLTPVLITACSSPNSAPATSTPVSYSASAFFNTQPLGDTDRTPSPACFPGQYLQEQLGLSDTQVIAIQALQDSLRLAIQKQITTMKASGTLNRDSVRALRQQYQVALQNGLANILTPAQLVQLKALMPPAVPPEHYGRGPLSGRQHNNHDLDSLQSMAPAVRDSIVLARMEQVLAAAGDTLTATQITLIEDLQASLQADTTLTPQARRAQFEAQLQTILNANQIAVLKPIGEGDRRRHRHG
ncbi:MAG: hypothetical protein Q8922_14975 [Bacteroidota bacterium]|nr:hypothetical protein [Bacteroidota bacterium]